MLIEALDLVCPYCEHRIEATLGTAWSGYGPGETKSTEVVGFACLNSMCEATWNDAGQYVKPPRAGFK